jgi:2-polyprenyl-3-methyl-5-hydroxy-6-metoxy-1,4-benzoquinol methylase
VIGLHSTRALRRFREFGCKKKAKLSERSGTIADHPFGGRHPTSHERLSGRPWDASYQDGPAPWDIDEPQPALVRLASEGGFAGTVLDAGCATGANAVYIASLGLSVLGVDVAETALAIARKKAEHVESTSSSLRWTRSNLDYAHRDPSERQPRSVDVIQS